MNRPEQQIHQAIAQHLRQRGKPGLVWWTTNNNIAMRGRKGAVQGGIARGLGVRAGVSDIVALYQGRFYALELKADRGRPTAEQMQFIGDINAAGGFATIASGIDQALRMLEVWGLVIGKAALGRAA
jgi:hypothetical protein